MASFPRHATFTFGGKALYGHVGVSTMAEAIDFYPSTVIYSHSPVLAAICGMCGSKGAGKRQVFMPQHKELVRINMHETLMLDSKQI